MSQWTFTAYYLTILEILLLLQPTPSYRETMQQKKKNQRGCMNVWYLNNLVGEVANTSSSWPHFLYYCKAFQVEDNPSCTLRVLRTPIGSTPDNNYNLSFTCGKNFSTVFSLVKYISRQRFLKPHSIAFTNHILNWNQSLASSSRPFPHQLN